MYVSDFDTEQGAIGDVDPTCAALLIVRGYRDSAARDPYFPETVLIYGCYMVAFSADEQEEYTYLLYLCDLTLGCLICLTNIGTGHQLIQRKAKAQCFTPLLLPVFGNLLICTYLLL